MDKEVEAQAGWLGWSHSGKARFILKILSGASIFKN